MDRITDKQLNALCARINEATGSPATGWQTVDGRNRANVGHYHISHAYGGVNLERMSNESGGVSCPLGLGHRPKRELWGQMHAFLAGLEVRA